MGLIVTEPNGNRRPIRVGDRFADKQGTIYEHCKGGMLRAVRASSKKLSPGKAARKQRRAEELEKLK